MSNLKTITLVFLFLIGYCSYVSGQPTNYIENYQSIAIREMHRSGIPASITLAQGILESSWGNGSLALNANNHFGIKCKTYWTGPTFYIEDDDFKNGKLIKSCFRAYDNAESSYIDHTDFLMSNERYRNLFEFDHTDYVNWAHGLKKCGYATDKRYAEKLINNIQKYELHRFDTMPMETEVIVNNEIVNPIFSNDQNSFAIKPQAIQKEEIIPQAFTLPDNYQRGTGNTLFGTKGNAILEENSTRVYKKN